ncbi:MAG: hypothetical protein EP323_07275 [Gammaproteobacteria bacterium]|nr:MAG: hypothetical protein EP323_07275 [Gammaproteobacteria bacterium]
MALLTVDNPEQTIMDWLASRPADSDVLSLCYDFSQYYLDGKPVIRLLAICQLSGGQLVFTVGESRDSLCSELEAGESPASLEQFCAYHGWPLLSADQPLKLKPVAIPKPWGQEIWYTGIEQRGLSLVTDGVSSVPLPWALSVLPQTLVAGHECSINLLKILDPLPEEVFGDLYFELHEEKREVYVVTHVNQQAWPDGVGSIRFGFDEKIIADYETEEAFKQDYLAAVKTYESTRREIDARLDEYRLAEGVGLNDPVSASQLKAWLAQLPEALLTRESQLRKAMNRFTSLLPLRVGDVVKVPLLTPHALQHGVRTVEFQTPVYERQILAFAQKVLTQSHWDSGSAVEIMSLDKPAASDLTILTDNDNYRLEEVVSFDDFKVERLTLFVSGDRQYQLPETGNYALLMSVDGELHVGGQKLSPEEAMLVPALRVPLTLNNRSGVDLTLLIAWPA